VHENASDPLHQLLLSLGPVKYKSILNKFLRGEQSAS
jgi:hypothetical protein